MSLYVDENMPTLRNSRWHWDSVCHLFADSDEELHAFAARIGLKRSWFSGQSKRLNHYDLTPGKRTMAISLGAIPVDRAFVSDRIRKNMAKLCAECAKTNAFKDMV